MHFCLHVLCLQNKLNDGFLSIGNVLRRTLLCLLCVGIYLLQGMKFVRIRSPQKVQKGRRQSRRSVTCSTVRGVEKHNAILGACPAIHTDTYGAKKENKREREREREREERAVLYMSILYVICIFHLFFPGVVSASESCKNAVSFSPHLNASFFRASSFLTLTPSHIYSNTFSIFIQKGKGKEHININRV